MKLKPPKVTAAAADVVGAAALEKEEAPDAPKIPAALESVVFGFAENMVAFEAVMVGAAAFAVDAEEVKLNFTADVTGAAEDEEGAADVEAVAAKLELEPNALPKAGAGREEGVEEMVADGFDAKLLLAPNIPVDAAAVVLDVAVAAGAALFSAATGALNPNTGFVSPFVSLLLFVEASVLFKANPNAGVLSVFELCADVTEVEGSPKLNAAAFEVLAAVTATLAGAADCDDVMAVKPN